MGTACCLSSTDQEPKSVYVVENNVSTAHDRSVLNIVTTQPPQIFTNDHFPQNMLEGDEADEFFKDEQLKQQFQQQYQKPQQQ